MIYIAYFFGALFVLGFAKGLLQHTLFPEVSADAKTSSKANEQKAEPKLDQTPERVLDPARELADRTIARAQHGSSEDLRRQREREEELTHQRQQEDDLAARFDDPALQAFLDNPDR